MFTSQVQAICILAFVIAPLSVFADTSGRTKLPPPPTPPPPPAEGAAEAIGAGAVGAGPVRAGAVGAAAAAAAGRDGKENARVVLPTIHPALVEAVGEAAAVAAPELAAATLASSTITNDVGGDGTEGGRQPEANDEVTTVAVTTTMMRARQASADDEEPAEDDVVEMAAEEELVQEAVEEDEEEFAAAQRGAENTEVPATNFGSKSRAPTLSEETANADGGGGGDDGGSGGNGAKTQIKNAKTQATSEERPGAAAVASTTRAGLETTNEQETSTMANPVRAGRLEIKPAPPAHGEGNAAGAPPASAHLAEQYRNGLYRIKLAEIVTDDEYSGRLPEAEPAAEDIATKAASHAHGHPHTTAPPKPTTTTAASHEQQQQQQRLEQQEHHESESESASQSEAGTASRQNIADLYPLKMEDFNPIIRESNAKLLKERTVFTRGDDAEHRQNLLPNEVEAEEGGVLGAAKPPARAMATHVNRSPGAMRGNSISDFTGKLLAEQDGVITEIEQKFRLDEYSRKAGDAGAATSGNGDRTRSHSVNHKIHSRTGVLSGSLGGGGGGGGSGHDFIDRRVKKSFDFPMHRAAASDAMAVPHIDFANTKFNSDAGGHAAAKGAAALAAAAAAAAAGGGAAKGSAATANVMAPGAHPEFSTTKFYNSKELYNEMLLHSKHKALKAAATTLRASKAPTEAAASASASASEPTVDLQSSAKLETLAQFGDGSAAGAATARRVALTPSTAAPTTMAATTITPTPITPTPTPTTTSRPIATTSAEVVVVTTTWPRAAESTTPGRKYQKELKRAKLFLKAMFPAPIASVTTKNNNYNNNNPNNNNGPNPNSNSTNNPSSSGGRLASEAAAAPTTAAANSESESVPRDASSLPAGAALSAIADMRAAGSVRKAGADLAATTTAKTHTATSDPNAAAAAPSDTATPTTLAAGSGRTTTAKPAAPHRATNPTKSTSRPIARPRILSRLQEKINSLECDIQNVPQDSHLWRGNETHELLLPIVSPENCQAPSECTPVMVSWEGEAEIQSGDILIVEINDLMLHPTDLNYTNSAHTTQVYQVTRSGHEHCDVTEGILLDITPLVVDGRKLVTLYDKDLTEGVNLLIVVSELWGSQCVRLKVTTKTDNCGENSDCSGKGICYSNAAMEEYECQCCGGFAGPHCEEIDACTPSPCTNNGICVDLSQGHEGNAYQCLCPYGYTGKNCQYESDPCNPTECLNGGSCVGNSTHFRCDCTPGYTGPLCQHSLNECESSPCVHGICVDQEDGFRCFCQPGFAGELCNFEYNECESNPCQNAGECIDHIGSYECRCTKGYTGNRCQIKVDFCANKPCPDGHRCIDHGNDFGCECPGGRNGPDCNQMPRTQCNVNPCTHGGTCWSSGESFYCACRPGYTGTMCEDEFVVETVVSSSEFMVDDTSARNFNDKTFGSSVVLKSPIELHNAYFAAGVLAAAIFIVAIVVTICHCKVNQTYRKFSTRSSTFFPILGFGRRPKSQNKLNKHWLSGKGLGGSGGSGGSSSGGNPLRSSSSSASLTRGGHLPATAAGNQQYTTTGSAALHNSQLHERPFQRHLAMNLENDMYYTVDFSENSQHSPLIQ